MQKFGQCLHMSYFFQQNQCTEGTVTYLGLVVQSRVRFNPGLKFDPLFYSNKIQKNSNSEQHFDCFIESTFRLGCSHHLILMMTTT